MTNAAIAHAIVTDVAADNALAARMIHPRAEVASALRVALTKGEEIRAAKLRYQEDLDEARALKLRWTGAVNDLLNSLFDNTSVADYCNEWVGKIFPEYAEVGNFIEQFYEEMDYRLAKLQSVLQRVEQVQPLSAAPLTAPAAPAPAAPQPVANLAGGAAAVNAVAPQPPQVAAPTIVPAMSPQTARVAPNVAGVVTHDTPAPGARVAVIGAPEGDPTRSAAAALLKRLNVAGQSQPAGADPIASGTTDAAVFVVPAQPSDAAQARAALFDLGCAVGRLGAARVVVLHPPGAPTFPEARVAHVPADPAGAWHLQLARHLKQAGVGVDLNKLC